jgi:hypothetical protein
MYANLVGSFAEEKFFFFFELARSFRFASAFSPQRKILIFWVSLKVTLKRASRRYLENFQPESKT